MSKRGNARRAFICRKKSSRCSPSLVSNGLASLQQGQLRYVKTVRVEFTKEGQLGHVHLANGAIRVAQRFSYEQVGQLLEQLEEPKPELTVQTNPAIFAMLRRMRDLALILREKRKKRGALELSMPESGVGIRQQRPRQRCALRGERP